MKMMTLTRFQNPEIIGIYYRYRTQSIIFKPALYCPVKNVNSLVGTYKKSKQEKNNINLSQCHRPNYIYKN